MTIDIDSLTMTMSTTAGHSYCHLFLLLAFALDQLQLGVARAFSSPQSCHALSTAPPISSPPSAFAAAETERRRVPGPRSEPGRPRSRLSLREDGDRGPSDRSDGVARRSSFAEYGRPRDITAESFGPLLPIAEAVDEATGGWGLSYADLRPATPRTAVGRAFLATNAFYAASGLWLGAHGDWFYGGLTELAGAVSFVYHYAQLDLGKNRSEVRLALLIDYLAAGSALLCGGVYMVQGGIANVPIDTWVSAGVAIATLSACWVWEFGYPVSDIPGDGARVTPSVNVQLPK